MDTRYTVILIEIKERDIANIEKERYIKNSESYLGFLSII
jgi:hypothetical protein